MKVLFTVLALFVALVLVGCEAPSQTIRPVMHDDAFAVASTYKGKLYAIPSQEGYNFAKNGWAKSERYHQYHLQVSEVTPNYGKGKKVTLHLSMGYCGLPSEGKDKKFVVVDPGTLTQPSDTYYIIVWGK